MSAEAHNQETTEPDNTNVGLIATVTIVGALLVVSTAAALTALVRTESARLERRKGAERAAHDHPGNESLRLRQSDLHD